MNRSGGRAVSIVKRKELYAREITMLVDVNPVDIATLSLCEDKFSRSVGNGEAENNT